ncbi:alkaline phosphatase family protein [Cyclobacterium sp. SYSU L10401]|uniref:alkaline phosphatase family protein n=1 Tax=Cyclobacterium sp. SYSU L10401 TaxID=2678657 RepID=UPI0013D1DD2B|nr:nucleotide pyrophosphatase/phosphodiesterase family protein [Cyclobacterium sp. SYSU L10401]
MKKTVVLNVVALSGRVLGEHTPFLSQWIGKRKQSAIKPVLPAVTCSSQSVYLTGKWPQENGIVGNGWYFKDECEIKFWRQSNHLVQSPKVWDALKAEDPNFTCANMFWWYNMYSTVDYAVTPRPLYPSDGRKLPDIHSQPMDLRDRLQKELGQFPLFSFWGPNANIASSRWIAEASMKVDEWHDPTLTFIYLPHLDYSLQKYGIDFDHIGKELKEIDALCERLINYYENQGAEVILLSEYAITSVSQPIHINRALRKAGYIQVKQELGLETLDAGTSKAFAVSDHQIAHIYINDPAEKETVKALVQEIPGVEMVLDRDEKESYHLNHERAGDLVAVADKDSWFTYYYWLDDQKAPDYARTVDIHRKPGYDPVEMFANPDIKFLKAKLGWTLLKKKLGFRYLMDVIPLDASLVKGSHGRVSESELDWPVLVTPGETQGNVEPTAIFSLIYDQVMEK